MRDDPLHVTSWALAQLRRAITFHHARTIPARTTSERARAGRREGGLPGCGTSRRSEPQASRSLTERHLRVLGVGQPPDRGETGIPGLRW